MEEHPYHYTPPPIILQGVGGYKNQPYLIFIPDLECDKLHNYIILSASNWIWQIKSTSL